MALAAVTSEDASSIAFAEEPSLSDRETARALFQEGDEKYRRGDYKGALKAFEAADEIMRLPTTGLERGRTLARVGRLLEAREVLLGVSRLPETTDENEVQMQARRDASALAETVATRIPSLSVHVAGIEVGYELLVDGERVPDTLAKFPRKIDPGEHVVVVRAPEYRTETRTLAVGEGETRELTLELRRASEAGAPDAWGGGAADDEPSDGGFGVSDVPVLSWVSFAVGAAGLVTGAVAGGITLSRVGKLEERCDADKTCDPAQQEDIDRARLSAHVSTAGFVLAGVGVAVGVIALFAWPREDATVSMDLQLGAGSAGVAGAF